MRAKLIVVIVGAVLVAAMPLAAHHSFSSEYDQGKTLSLQGKVIQFDWVNPHSWVHVEVTNADGTKTIWRGETAPVNVLIRNGWTKPAAMAMVGQKVTLRGPAAKDGSNHVFATGVTLDSGGAVFGLQGGPPTP